MKACSFLGHRDTPQTEELKQKVREIVERLIEDCIGNSVEVTIQPLEGTQSFESSYIDLTKIINIEIEEED